MRSTLELKECAIICTLFNIAFVSLCALPFLFASKEMATSSGWTGIYCSFAIAVVDSYIEVIVWQILLTHPLIHTTMLSNNYVFAECIQSELKKLKSPKCITGSAYATWK